MRILHYFYAYSHHPDRIVIDAATQYAYCICHTVPSVSVAGLRDALQLRRPEGGFNRNVLHPQVCVGSRRRILPCPKSVIRFKVEEVNFVRGDLCRPVTHMSHEHTMLL